MMICYILSLGEQTFLSSSLPCQRNMNWINDHLSVTIFIGGKFYWFSIGRSKIHRNLSPLKFFIHVKWRTIYIQCFLVDLFSRPCTYGSHPIIRFYFSFWQEENLNLHNFCQIPLQWILHDCIEYIDRYN